jgi:hypothetical protein
LFYYFWVFVKNPYAQSPKASSSIRFRAKTAKILEEIYNKHIKTYIKSKKDEEFDAR